MRSIICDVICAMICSKTHKKMHADDHRSEVRLSPDQCDLSLQTVLLGFLPKTPVITLGDGRNDVALLGQERSSRCRRGQERGLWAQTRFSCSRAVSDKNLGKLLQLYNYL